MENPYEAEMKQKRKILIATVAMIVIILGLLVWVIVAAITQSGSNADDTQPIVATEESIPENAASTTSETIVSDSAADSATTNTQTTPNSAVAAVTGSASTSADMPATGPVDLGLTALLAGIAAYLVVHYFNSRRALASLPINR